MSPYNLNLMLQAQSAMVEVEGMKAANQAKLALELSPEYSEADFNHVREFIESLANDINHEVS